MPKLNDTQTILLSAAAQRNDHSLYPLPDSHQAAGTLVTKAIERLIKSALAEERETNVPDATSRTDGDLRYGVFATPAGLTAISVETDSTGGSSGLEGASDPVPGTARQTKAAAVLTLLERDAGATLPELIANTGWLPHTTRAALTGLRKKGHAIERFKRDDVTCYRIAR